MIKSYTENNGNYIQTRNTYEGPIFDLKIKRNYNITFIPR